MLILYQIVIGEYGRYHRPIACSILFWLNGKAAEFLKLAPCAAMNDYKREIGIVGFDQPFPTLKNGGESHGNYERSR